MSETEVLGICEWCGKDVTYHSDMDSYDPGYPTWEFDHEAKEDRVYHWACMHPAPDADEDRGR